MDAAVMKARIKALLETPGAVECISQQDQRGKRSARMKEAHQNRRRRLIKETEDQYLNRIYSERFEDRSYYQSGADDVMRLDSALSGLKTGVTSCIGRL